MTPTHPFGSPTMIDLGHSRVPHYQLGRGPDLLFIHGWPLHAATFRNVVPMLADHFTCHLLDLPGTGHSEWSDDTPISFQAHAHSVRQFAHAIGLRRYGLIAHDSGGAIARLLAAEDDRVFGLVLSGTEIPGHHPWRLKMLLAMAHVPMLAEAFRVALRLRALRRSTLAFGACFEDKNLCGGDFHELFVRPILESGDVLRGQYRLLRTFDWRVIDGLAQTHGRITAPAHLIWGAHDPYFPVDKVKATLSQYGAGATLRVLDPGRLFVHEEAPHAYAEAAMDFLRPLGEPSNDDPVVLPSPRASSAATL